MKSAIYYLPFIPVLMLALSGIIVLILGTITDRFPKGKVNHWMPPEYFCFAVMVPTLVMSAAAVWASFSTGAGATYPLWFRSAILPMIHIDPFAAILGLVAVIATLAVMVLSTEYFGDHNTLHRGEYFALLFFGTAAILLVCAATDLVMIYLSIEFLSLCSYVLANYWKKDPKSSEAGLKYFLFGALSSAIMLYGMSMIYGMVGSTNMAAMSHSLAAGNVISMPAALAAVIMVITGIGFKLALVPFHLWAPDTYEGAPTTITAWLSVASKAAGLAIITRFLLVAAPNANWHMLVVVLAAASMTLGNLVAITQKNIKRMLAYSSIAQVGYMLIGLLSTAYAVPAVGGLAVTAGNNGTANYGLAGLLVYAASYLFMNIGAFAVIVAVERKLGSTEIETFSGLWHRAPFLAGSMVVFFMSLAGIPPTAGFLGKMLVFAGAIQSGHPDMLTLAIIGIANSVISVFYYFNVVRVMFMVEPASKAPVTASRPLQATVAVMLVMTIALLVGATPFWKLITMALTP